jgi:hypothetical protein
MRLHLSTLIAFASVWPVAAAAQTPPSPPPPSTAPATGQPNHVAGDVGERGSAAKPAQGQAPSRASAPAPAPSSTPAPAPSQAKTDGPQPTGEETILEDIGEAFPEGDSIILKIAADYGVSDNLSVPTLLDLPDPFEEDRRRLERMRDLFDPLHKMMDEVLFGGSLLPLPLTDDELRPPLSPLPKPDKPKCGTPPPRQAADQPVESILDEIEPPSTEPRPKTGDGVSQAPALDPSSSALLAYHNQLRAKVGSPPLAWNAALAAHAAEYAQVMANSGQMVHSSRVGREKERENLALSPHGTNSASALVQLWGKEQALFRPGTFPSICAGDWSQCAHFTQMVWSTTTDVGCGFAQGRQFDALVCRYTPPGNRDGSPVITQVAARPAIESCPAVAIAGAVRD